jgi:hypothetical protein
MGKKLLSEEVKRLRVLMELNNLVNQVLSEEYLHEITSKDAKAQYYQNINPDLYVKIVNLDPTYNPANDRFGGYDKWLLKPDNVKIIQKTREEDFYKIKEDLAIYDRLKRSNKLSPEYKDISKINLKQLTDFIFNNYTSQSDFDINSITSQKQEVKNIKKDAEKYTVGDFTIINPKTEESACFYGKGTRWCTAAEYDNRFDTYNSDGKLWILIDKNDPTEKLQFHFESEQFMDAKDYPINIGEFFDEHNDVYNFFLKLYPNINFMVAKNIAENGNEENFSNYYSNDFDNDQKEEIITTLLSRVGGGESDYDYDTTTAVDMLEQIKYDFKSYKNGGSYMTSNESHYRNALEGTLRYDSENSKYNNDSYYSVYLISIFGGLTDDDMQILYDELHAENFNMMMEIIKSFNNGNQVLNKFIDYNDLNDEFKMGNEMLKVVIQLQNSFSDYPVLENKLVKITINDTDYQNQTFNIDLENKNKNGKIVKKLSGNIDYRNIYNYLNNYSLFESLHRSKLITEVKRLRNLMELNTTEVKVHFRAGVPFNNMSTGEQNVFVGNESGKILSMPNTPEGQLRVSLDDGRMITTTDDAIDELNNGLDDPSKEEFVNNNGGGSGTFVF